MGCFGLDNAVVADTARLGLSGSNRTTERCSGEYCRGARCVVDTMMWSRGGVERVDVEIVTVGSRDGDSTKYNFIRHGICFKCPQLTRFFFNGWSFVGYHEGFLRWDVDERQLRVLAMGLDCWYE